MLYKCMKLNKKNNINRIVERLINNKYYHSYSILYNNNNDNNNNALIYHEHGAVEKVITYEEMNLSDLGDDDIQVKFLASPINPADFNMIEGVYDIRPPLPAVGGNEGVCVVENIGNNVKNLKIGDWVIPAHPGFGTWRQRAICNYNDMVPVPNDIPADYAATISVNPCTAYRMLHDFVNLKPGDIVVQNGATSAVGTAVIQMAKGMGLHTINIIRDRPDLQEVVERLESLGADVVVTEEFAKSFKMKELMKNFDRRPTLGLNCVGGESGLEITRLLSNNSPMITYGGMSRKPVTIPTGKLIFNNLSLHGFWLSRWIEEKPREERVAMLSDVVKMIRDGHLKMYNENFNFQDYSKALKRAKEGYRNQKVVLMF